jgi:hypothetical protein
MAIKRDPDFSAASMARELGMNDKYARAILRARGFSQPYLRKNYAKMMAVLRGALRKAA